MRARRDDARIILWTTLVSAAVSGVYGYSAAMVEGGPQWAFFGIERGAFTGAVIAVILISFEVLAEARQATAPFVHAPFLLHLAVKTAIYLVVILSGLAAGAWLFPIPADAGVRSPIRWHDVLFSFVVAFVFNFVMDINSLLGQNVLLNFLSGRYHQPRLEQRVFLFIDMQGSTTLAERLGALTFHRLVNRFVVDLTAPIVAARGEIHRYVGDELIATWRLADGIADARCVRACFAALDRLAALAPDYVREFGMAVTCHAALHCGPVVTGEMGSVKKEIVFLGDTVNTTARIEELCRRTGDRVLASAALIDLLELPAGIAKRPLGDLPLRGKQHNVALYALEEIVGEAATAA